MTHIIALTNRRWNEEKLEWEELNKGDNENARAVQASLKAQYDVMHPRPVFPTNISEYPIDQVSQLVADIKNFSGRQYIIIGAGSQSISSLTEIADIDYRFGQNTMTVWSGHQKEAELTDEAIAKIDAINLPKHEIGYVLKEKLKSKLVTTENGVPNLKTSEHFNNAFHDAAKNGIEIPQADEYITVILGGDAPMQNIAKCQIARKRIISIILRKTKRASLVQR